MPRPALTEEQRRLIRRNIREAAARLYAENGINNVSVRAVAQQAGVSVGTVYSHFGSLSELMQSLWRRPARKLVQQMTRLAEDLPDPADRLKALLEAYVRFYIEEPQVFRGAFMFVRPENLEAPEQTALEDDAFFSLFRDAIIAGQNEGRFRSGDPDTLGQLIIGSVHGALTLPINLHRLALSEGPEIARQAIAAQLDWLQAGCN
jgi:AcrR family transcriptional regulator